MYPITEQDVEIINTFLEYCPDEAVFRWKKKASKKSVVGEIAGTWRPDGYCLFQVNGRKYLLHRAIYAVLNGECVGEIDHINGDTRDNRPENLRPVTRSQQNMNRKVQANNTSGYKGVSWYNHKTQGGYWQARIKVAGKYICLGYHKSKETASAAYSQAAEKYHGEYRRAF